MSRASAAAVLLIALLSSLGASAATRRALVIGIDRYQMETQLAAGAAPAEGGTGGGRDAWTDLSGAVNDSDIFAALLQTHFGFEEKNVQRLRNEEATADGIRAAFKALAAQTQRGDVVVFYYAGHGSQVVNSKSPEQDKLDETLVPSDSWRGTQDIRDKELATLFDSILKKGGQLTAVLDSCHSGSIARGPLGETAVRARTLPPDPRDVADPGRGPDVEKKGALVLAAAQQDESAYEATDDQGNQRGRLSLALQQALRQASPGEPADRVFRRVRALMGQFGSPTQQPALSGNAQRRKAPLFGGSTADAAKGPVVAVRRVSGAEVVLQGGLDLLLHPGSELVLAGADERKDPATPRVRITRLEGLVESHGTVISGEPARLAKGALLEVVLWGAPSAPSLRVAIPSTPLEPAALVAAFGVVTTAARAAGLALIDAAAEVTPELIVFWSDGQWRLSTPRGETVALGATPAAEKLSKVLQAEAKTAQAARKQLRPPPTGAVTLFVNLPPTAALARALKVGPDTPNNAIVKVAPDQADYVLVGRASDGALQYAWLRPTFGQSQSTLPVSSSYVPVDPLARGVAQLEQYAQRLARVSGWLELQAPGAGGEFPYRLALRRGSTPVKEGEPLAGGTEYVVGIESEGELFGSVPRRYVYVFVIDRTGASTLVFPHPDEGDLENRFPFKDQDPKPFYELSRVTASEPYGFDTWVMINTNDKLGDPLILESDGVRTRGPAAGRRDPLSALLGDVGSASRGATRAVPSKWAVDRLTVQSVPPAKGQKAQGGGQ